MNSRSRAAEILFAFGWQAQTEARLEVTRTKQTAKILRISFEQCRDILHNDGRDTRYLHSAIRKNELVLSEDDELVFWPRYHPIQKYVFICPVQPINTP